MLAHLTRLIFLGQRWPFRPTGDSVADERVLQDRFRGVMGGMVTYVLTSFILAGLIYAFLSLEAQIAPDGEKVNVLVFGASLACVAFMVWAFRLYWAFVPAALNYPIRDYLRALGGMRTSFYMIGTWLICYLPLLFIFTLLAASIVSMVGGMPPALTFLFTLVQVIVATASTMVATVGIGFAIRAMMKPE